MADMDVDHFLLINLGEGGADNSQNKNDKPTWLPTLGKPYFKSRGSVFYYALFFFPNIVTWIIGIVLMYFAGFWGIVLTLFSKVAPGLEQDLDCCGIWKWFNG